MKNIIKFEEFLNERFSRRNTDKTGKFNENVLPRPYKKVKCLECGEEVCDNLNYKIGHLYNKHNCKPSVNDYKAKKMLKQYFPQNIKEEFFTDNIYDTIMDNGLGLRGTPNGVWHMKTKDVKDIDFYHGNENENPLEKISSFDRGKYWGIDAGSNRDLFEFYNKDPEDDSFVLIPKKDVIRVWFVSHEEDDRFKPKRIRMVRDIKDL